MASRKDSEEPLKAVVFADACGADEPISLASHKPLLNIPILSWQLATLARYGVKEAIVLSSAPLEGPYSDPLGRMKVTNLSSPSWTGEGDAIRDIEGRDDLRPVDDFVLVRRGSVFNVDVARLVFNHKQRRDVDRNWLITSVFRRGAGSAGRGLVIAIDSASRTLVKYTEMLTDSGINIDVRGENAGLLEGGQLEVCSDVLDVGLDVCAPDFLLEFRENFYYGTVRAYIKEKLDGGEAEVFGNRMYVHFVESQAGEYGSRITSLASFTQVTSDVLNGWMCPVTVDSIMGIARRDKEHEFSSDYLVERCAIGGNVSIAVGSTIVECVIGNNVKIGSDVTLVQSVLMDGAIVADRVEIERSVIDSKCTVREDCRIQRNCFLDEEVYLGVGCQSIPPHSFVTLRDLDELNGASDDEDDDEQEDRQTGGMSSKERSQQDRETPIVAEKATSSMIRLGAGGKGQLIEPTVAVKLDRFFVQRGIPIAEFDSDEEDEIEDEDGPSDEEDQPTNGGRADVNGQVDSLADGIEHATLDDAVDDESSRISKFSEEMLETVERAFAEDVEVDNTALEVNSLKLVYHCSFAETLTGLVAGLANTVKKRSSDSTLYAGVVNALKKYQAVISKFCKDDEIHHVQVASSLAQTLSEDGTLLTYVFKVMFDEGMLEEEGILSWAAAEKKRVQAGECDEALLNELTPFLDWLQDSDDEDEDEDED